MNCIPMGEPLTLLLMQLSLPVLFHDTEYCPAQEELISEHI